MVKSFLHIKAKKNCRCKNGIFRKIEILYVENMIKRIRTTKKLGKYLPQIWQANNW